MAHENCNERENRIQKRANDLLAKVDALRHEIAQVFCELADVTRNTCCSDPDCPTCRDYPEKQQFTD